METIRQIAQLVPVGLAIIVLLRIGFFYNSSRRRRSDRLSAVIISIACAMIIVARTSEFWSEHIQKTESNSLASNLWLFFDTLVMVSMIIRTFRFPTIRDKDETNN